MDDVHFFCHCSGDNGASDHVHTSAGYVHTYPSDYSADSYSGGDYHFAYSHNSVNLCTGSKDGRRLWYRNEKSGPLACPSGDYCQPWNPSYYQCRRIDTAKCGQQQVGVDFYGDDISSLSVLLPELCCDKCRATPGCKAYTFVNYNADGKPMCYLKRGSGDMRVNPRAVSAMVQTPASGCSVPSGGRCGSDKEGVSCCPSGEFCQPWNPFYYQCRPAPAKCANQETGIDYLGDDIKTIEGIFAWDCCDQCAATAGCKAYTFVNYNANGKSACYLKKGTGERRVKASAVSSTVLAPMKSKCTYSSDVDFYGNDLFTVYGLTSEQCCDKCTSTSGCKAFTLVKVPKRTACYLKTSSTGKKGLSGAVSGSVN